MPIGLQIASLITALLAGVAAIVSAVGKRKTDTETVQEAARAALAADRATIVAEYRGLYADVIAQATADRDRYDRELGAVKGKLTDVSGELASVVEERDQCRADLRKLTDRVRALEGAA